MTDRLLTYFHFHRLPPDLAPVSEPFCLLAQWIDANLPQNPERTVALRKLIESRDAAVRARIYLGPDE
jgi:hypothetical protein